jgi:hypothetical protein
MKRGEYTEQQALSELSRWGLGIRFSSVTKMILIPRDSIIGLKKWGWLDYLKKFEWKLMRVAR